MCTPLQCTDSGGRGTMKRYPTTRPRIERVNPCSDAFDGRCSGYISRIGLGPAESDQHGLSDPIRRDDCPNTLRVRLRGFELIYLKHQSRGSREERGDPSSTFVFT